MKYENLTPGTRIGRWTILGPATPDHYGRRTFTVRCICGFTAVRGAYALDKGKTSGCAKKECISAHRAAGVGMMPGQEPYTETELEQLHGLVADAAAADVTEQDEVDGVTS